MDKKETVWLYVGGDEYASMLFEQNFDKYDVYNEMIANNIDTQILKIEDTNIEIEILKFGEVDSSFELFIKRYLCGDEVLEHENLYRIDLENIEHKDEQSVDNEMELGNILFGNSRGTYSLDRGIWQKTFFEFLDEIGLDSYGYVEDEKLKEYQTDRGGFENDTFIINPYYWGDDESIMQEHNFIYKPTGYEIDWYKYPLRDSYANKKVTFKEFKEILNECKKSVKK